MLRFTIENCYFYKKSCVLLRNIVICCSFRVFFRHFRLRAGAGGPQGGAKSPAAEGGRVGGGAEWVQGGLGWRVVKPDHINVGLKRIRGHARAG